MKRSREEIIDAEVLSEQSGSSLLSTKQSTIIGAILLALSILAGIVWLLTQSLQQEETSAAEQAATNSREISTLQERMEEAIQGLKRAVESSNQSGLELLERQQQQSEAQEKQISERLHLQQEQMQQALQQATQPLQEQNRQLNQSVAALAQRVNRREDNLHLSSALRLLQIAEEQLLIARNLDGAEQALAQAGRQLSETGDPLLLPIQGVIREEIRLINQTTIPDLHGPMSELSQIISTIDSLKIPERTSGLQQEGPAATPVATDPPSEWNWRAILNKIWGDILTLVRVEKKTQELPLIATQSEERISRQILQLRLEQAQSALLLRDSSLFRERIQSVQQWLKIFDQQDSQVHSISQQLTRLESLDLSPQLPVIGLAHKRLKAVVDGAPLSSAEPPESQAP